jgi:[acyl-carrier-protein] S-malonyltransferase
MTSNNNLAMVFPGQGSQSLGILSDLAKDFAIVEKTFAEASDVLGYDLWSLVQNGPEKEINRTEKTQPAMLAAGVATWRVWKEKAGPSPVFLAGHSLGEYTALVCAGSIAFSDAVTLVADRGKVMQDAVPDGIGAMAAILGLDDDDVIRLCNQSGQGEIVSAANFNSPGQVVIAGHRKAVERVVDLARETGAKRSVILPVSVPSHCALMTEAAERFSEQLRLISFIDASIPVIQNVDACPHTTSDDILPILLAQLYKPVRWVDTVHTMTELGIGTIIECGPGRVLSGLIKRIDRTLKILPIFDLVSLDKAVSHFTGGSIDNVKIS